jgi:aminoglycoside 6'-N-acetyltransferase
MIALREATLDDIPLLQWWDQQEHVIQADPEGDWDWAYELPRVFPWRELLIAELEGRPIGFLQIIDPHEEETHYWGKIGPHKRAIDIWIGEKDDLGKGYGTEMMKLALQRCFEPKDVEEVLIDPLESNVDAIRFYERLGFEFVEKREFDGDQCLVYRMRRRVWEELYQ